MSGREQVEKLWINILGLGGRRLAALGLIGATVLFVVAGGAYYLSQPTREPLYTGLNRDDIGQIGSVLKDAGIIRGTIEGPNTCYCLEPAALEWLRGEFGALSDKCC